MPNTKTRGIIAAALLMTAALACALPFQDASVPPPTPDTRVGTSVAGTVAAAMDLTATALVPTATIPPTSTPAPTETATPEESGAGSSLTAQADGSTLFVDERAGYRVTIPAGWLAVRINEQEYLDAFLLPQAADDTIQKALLSIQNQNPDVTRLFVVDLMEGHMPKGLVTNVNIVWDEPFEIDFETDEELQALADEAAKAAVGPTVQSVNFVVPTNGDVYGEIVLETQGLTPSGESASIYQKLTVFDLPKGTLYITLTVESGFADTVLPYFTAMLDTLAIEKE